MIKDILKKAVIYIAGEGAYFKLRWLLRHGIKYYPMSCYWGIDGWLPEVEAIVLYDLALSLPNESPVVVEIGSWQGKSSVILAKGIRNKDNPLVYCIDPFDASGDTVYKEKLSSLSQSLKDIFINNVKRCRVGKYIKILQGKSFEFADSWSQNIDFLFIDGDHSYEAVLNDFLSWSKFIKPGGYIAFHDVFSEPKHYKDHPDGPYKVVKEYILDSDAWTDKKLVASLFIARKR